MKNRSPEDPRWTAVVNRDASHDGRFVYSVRTTGVYCRPSCGARRPRRENVDFHADAAAAARAGYRPCRRCKPDRLGREADRIAELCRFIERSEDPPTAAALAQLAGLSVSHAQRLFKQFVGVTPKQYAAACRANRLRDGFRDEASVTETIHEAGYGSSSRFYEKSKETLGMTPTEYRAGGPGLKIRFAVGECSLGSALVAATDRGVCAILLGDDPETLVQDLQDRFPHAELIGADSAFERTVAQVIGLIADPRSKPDLPLDIQGTAFQQRVWKALTKIPAGKTATYSEIAAAIGAPTSARAVARACAGNPIAVAIPCHRVVRTDGGLSGYRWGVERKRELLKREASPAKASVPTPRGTSV